MTNQEKLLKELGVSQSQIESLGGEESVDIKDIAAEVKTSNDNYYEGIYQPKIDKLEGELVKKDIKWRRGLKKAFELEIADKEITSKDFGIKDIVGKIKATNAAAIEGLKGGDEVLKGKLDELTAKYNTVLGERDDLIEGRGTYEQEVESRYEAKENAREVDKSLGKAYRSYELSLIHI